VDQARGVARVVDRVSRARLKVSLVSVLGWRPFWGDYWIIGLDPDYRWAIVGEPRRRFGWILARTQSLDSTTWTTIQAILERNGYDKQKFRLGLHRPGLVGGGGRAVLGGEASDSRFR
jgi:apolipoprotein D and lipocalin family protein